MYRAHQRAACCAALVLAFTAAGDPAAADQSEWLRGDATTIPVSLETFHTLITERASRAEAHAGELDLAIDGCVGEVRASAAAEEPTKRRQALDAAKRGFDAAKKDFDTAKSAFDNAKSAFDTAQKAHDAAESEARTAPAGSEEASARAAAVAAAEKAMDTKARAMEAARRDLESTTDPLADALDVYVGATWFTPEVLRVALDDEARVSQCAQAAALVDAIYAFSGNHHQLSAEAVAESREAAARRPLSDRGGADGSSLSEVGSLVEGVGAPETIVAAIATALGANSSKEGTQLIFTIRVGELLTSNKEALEAPSLLRHLFVRAGVPIEEVRTEGADPEADDGVEGRRVSFVLGTSLVDESDPRLTPHDQCYRLARQLTPPPSRLNRPEGPTVEQQRDRRAELFSVCSDDAESKHKLAFRLGVGLFTDEDADGAARTRLELLGAALVWEPAPALSLGLLYQYLHLPSAVHTVGGAVAVQAQLGAGDKGPWGAVGLNVTGLMVLPDGGDSYGQVQIAPDLRVRGPGGSIIRLAVGPRIYTHGGATDLLATVSLSFDMDALTGHAMNPQLVANSNAMPGGSGP